MTENIEISEQTYDYIKRGKCPCCGSAISFEPKDYDLTEMEYTDPFTLIEYCVQVPIARCPMCKAFLDDKFNQVV